MLLAGFALLFLPLSTAALCLNYAVLALRIPPTLRARLRRNRGFQTRTVLITGISTPQGLRIARAFHETGHDVVGAEPDHRLLPTYGRFSISVSKYRRLSQSLADEPVSEFIKEILELIEQFNIQIWIDCSQQRSTTNLRQAKTIIERKSRCQCFLPSDSAAAAFTDSLAFLSYTRAQGLPIIDNHSVSSRAEIHDVLNSSRGKKKYLLSAPNAAPVRALLPRRTPSQTYNEISKLRIQKDTKWHLNQQIDNQEKYTTFALVVRGDVKAFAASPASSSLQALPQSSALNKALTNYVETWCEKLGLSYTGHLSIDFCVDEVATATGVEKTILPIDGRIGSGATVTLFQGPNGSLDLVRSYLSVLTPTMNGVKHSQAEEAFGQTDIAYPSKTEKGVFSLGNEVLLLAILPLTKLLTLRMRLVVFLRSLLLLINHIAFWQESLYDSRDPLPFWWMYQIYLPVVLIWSCVRPYQTDRIANSSLMIS